MLMIIYKTTKSQLLYLEKINDSGFSGWMPFSVGGDAN